MKRRPEPELIEDAEQALAYAQADFLESNALFIKLLGRLEQTPLHRARALDLGYSSADIVCRFLRAWPQATCDALDGSVAMLRHARAALDRLPGVTARTRLLCECIPRPTLPKAHYDLILSNGLLHQLHNPQVLWQTVRAATPPGAQVLIMDLMRPASAGWAETLVATYAAGEPEVLRTDFRNSLFAAFEPTGVVEQLVDAGLSELEVAVVSDRHLVVLGRLQETDRPQEWA